LEKKKKYIILKITNQGIYYNASGLIDWKHTNFPPKDCFKINERNGIFWEVEMLSFDKSSGTLDVRVVDYECADRDNIFSSQTPKYEIKRLIIHELIWSYFEQFLSSYRHNAFKDIALFNSKKETEKTKYSNFEFGIPMNKKVEVESKFPLMKTTFKMGYVELLKKVKGLKEPVKIALYNDHIIPEFDHVKPFFKKALGKKMIDVTGTIEIKINGEVKVDCHSKAIDNINEGVISSVKRLKLRSSIYDPKVIPVDKSLFTPEDYFEKTDEQLGNTFHRNDKDIINDILDLEGIRNRRELMFLSGKLQSKNRGLRFTLSPKFGFLFYVEGEEMDHFIWELLDSHATYIWSIDKIPLSLEMKYKLLDREINFIRDNGRRAFLDNVRESEFLFSRVKHGESGLVDGFSRWKSLVKEKLV